MTIDEMLADIRNQLESEEGYTEYGKPEAWVYLENGRSIQIAYEGENCTLVNLRYFSVTLHCSEGEYDNGYYHETRGLMAQAFSDSAPNLFDIEVIRQPLKYMIKVNKSKKLRCQSE